MSRWSTMPVLELYPFTSTKLATLMQEIFRKTISTLPHRYSKSCILLRMHIISTPVVYPYFYYGSFFITIKTCILTASKSRAVRKGEKSLWMSHAGSHDVSDGDVLNMRRISKIIPDDLDVVSMREYQCKSYP